MKMSVFTSYQSSLKILLILLLSFGFTGCSLMGETTRASQQKQHKKVIVIGAGIAGLAAAKKLHNKGYDVHVIEARDRIGGRIWTDRSGKNPLDMGAGWIHGITGNPITRLSHKAGATFTSKTDYDNAVIYGKKGERDVITRSEFERYRNLFDQYMQVYLESNPKISVKQAIKRMRATGKFNFLSDQELAFLVNTEIEHEYAADAKRLSLEGFDEGEDWSGGDVLFADGYDKLTDYLAQGLKITLNAPVTQINYQGNHVIVRTTKHHYQADKVIVTVPLGVLKRHKIHFKPALPKNKQVAINALEMGTLNKVWMTFPYMFWVQDSHMDLIQYVGNGKGKFAEWYNIYKYNAQPILLGFNAGSYAQRLEHASDQVVTAKAMKVLRRIYGNHIPDPIEVKITRWNNDPYAYGAYSYLPVGADYEHREILKAPIDKKIYFAGEATSIDNPATTQGAYLSGLREAKRILESK